MDPRDLLLLSKRGGLVVQQSTKQLGAIHKWFVDLLLEEAMEALDRLLSDIQPPWNSKMRSVLLDFHPGPFPDDLTVLSSFGFVTEVFDNSFNFQLAELIPIKGVSIVEPKCEVKAVCCKNFELPIPTSWIGFKNANILSHHPLQIQMHQHTALWEIPAFNKYMPLSFGHLFAGAFCGWDRALGWQYPYGVRSFALDHDPTVMAVWQLQNNAKVFEDSCCSPGCKDLKYGILMGIGEEWYGLCRFLSNLAFTLSPPCTSWSLGGKGEGLACVNGFAMWEAAQATKWVRPIAALWECVDRTCVHPHFKIIQSAAQVIGYRVIWSQTVRYDALVSMARTRWLAVWIRHDIPCLPCFGNFKLADVHKLSWDDPMFCFTVPSQIRHQLVLSPKLLEIYGNVDFLPKGMRNNDCMTRDEVLKRRCIDNKRCMPTLCASYTNQHELAISHLQDKGIYAPLLDVEGSIQFIDPLKCAALLGATPHLPVMLPTKLKMTFLILGNAIAVPQALLAIRIMLTSCDFDQMSVTSPILQCWFDRITPRNVIILRNADFIFMTPCRLVEQILISHCIKNCTRFEVRCCIPGLMKTVTCPVSSSLCDVMHLIGIETPTKQGLVCQLNCSEITFSKRIDELLNKPLKICLNGEVILDMCLVHACEPIPTAVISSDEDSSGDDIDESDLLRAVREFESNEPKEVHVTPWTVIQAGSTIAHTVYWPIDIEPWHVSTRLAFLLNQPDSRRVISWYQSPQQPNDAPPIILADPHAQCGSEYVAVVITNQDDVIYGSKFVRSLEVPLNVVLGEFPGVVAISVNGTHVDMNVPMRFSTADVCKLFIAQHADSNHESTGKEFSFPAFNDRLQMLKNFEQRIGSDEISFITSIMKQFSGNHILSEPMHICFDSLPQVRKDIDAILQGVFRLKSKAWIPLCCKGHWAALEIEWFPLSKTMNVNAINLDEAIRTTLFHSILKTCNQLGCEFRSQIHVIPAGHGWCGWAVLY